MNPIGCETISNQLDVWEELALCCEPIATTSRSAWAAKMFATLANWAGKFWCTNKTFMLCNWQSLRYTPFENRNARRLSCTMSLTV